MLPRPHRRRRQDAAPRDASAVRPGGPSSSPASSSGWVLVRCSAAVLTVLLMALRGTTAVEAFRGGSSTVAGVVLPRTGMQQLSQSQHHLFQRRRSRSSTGRRRRLHSRRTKSDADPETTELHQHTPPSVVVLDWECVLDALPYYVELGIYTTQ